MEIYALKVNGLLKPLGVDSLPRFEWKLRSKRRGAAQTARRVTVSEDERFSRIVWDSGNVLSADTSGIGYGGEALSPCTRYFWRVSVTDEQGSVHTSGVSWFETGLMGTDASVWDGAQWIGSPLITDNPDGIRSYKISAELCFDGAGFTEFAIAARNTDNCVLVRLDKKNLRIRFFQLCDNSRTTGAASKTPLGDPRGWSIDEKLFVIGDQRVEISVRRRDVRVALNGAVIVSETELLPKNEPQLPPREGMMLFGIRQTEGRISFGRMRIENTENGAVLQDTDFSRESALSALGEIVDGRLVVKKGFFLTSAVPSVNVRKRFTAEKEVRSARLYSSAKGFYRAYINGKPAGDSCLDPGFTDYRIRILYQTYDVTDKLVSGENVISAVAAKGYYTGWVGYAPRPMVYGRQNTFIAKLVITYTDGSRGVIVTDGSWQFTDRGPVISSDYQQGEYYDARLEYDPAANHDFWVNAGVYPQSGAVIPTNGVLSGARFGLYAQTDAGARVERVLTPRFVSENPRGHFIYDFGQNMAGTVRLKMRSERGRAVKLRFGEMCRGGRLYTENLRSAASTDVYIFKGDRSGETFVPSFTAHGFRYMEISVCGKDASLSEMSDMLISAEGLVLTNTPENTAEFECSNPLINRLQENIQWGQRGNSLLVYTDCPQRNERMGWTGDAQVFAAAAAYNADIRAFMGKWLTDLRDAQLLYNKDGAVPDTAPLGGDNRPDGCGGWGDAAVIVPWEMYLAYGDKKFLSDNYEMMRKWIAYQNGAGRRNYGVRTVDGVQVPEKSDLASIPFIQIQQRRGDHLSYDGSTPYILSATAYAAHCADIMSAAAEILGKSADAKKYRLLFENIRRAFNEAWVCPDGTLAYWGEMSARDPQGLECAAYDKSITRYTRYAEGTAHGPSQTAYALAIDFGLIPKDKLSGAAAGLKAALDRCGGCLSTGFLGISHLMPALIKSGLCAEAVSLLENERFPGWLYSVKNGATTVWERWNSYIAETDTFGDAAMNSFNHYAYGAVGETILGDILGIRPYEPGYKTVLLSPVYGGGITWARGCYESVRGKIEVSWRISGNAFEYSCTVPANISAVLRLPVRRGGKVTESGKNAADAAGVTYEGTSGGRAVFRISSGSYVFSAEI